VRAEPDGAVDEVGRVLVALADPTRRHGLSLIAAHGAATATTLAGRLPVSRQAISSSTRTRGVAKVAAATCDHTTRRFDMTTLKPGSMLLGTTRPAELRAWYIKALAPEFTGEGAIDLGGFLLVIDGRDDVEAKNDEPGRTIINFHVDDFDAVEAQLNAAGVEWIAVEDREKGKFGTFADPDGNYLQIIEWKKDG
jgi:hypothetical protein